MVSHVTSRRGRALLSRRDVSCMCVSDKVGRRLALSISYDSTSTGSVKDEEHCVAR